ncbi:FAD-dependent oxidoreductase [Paradesertivirga mongoliensis]|uniref:FAD-dependent oxidoreductase n=1 Tax=Paradesertivirga mongoliensis TaxID=2100740 RepID=A0ABW4ZHP4_9SPHI|nr:FAD-dependent oxidoreductase [Pedobacter mongoliensis]
MIRNLTTLLCFFAALSGYAQNIKTGVVVVGSTPSAMSAAIQAARSGVKTLLIDAGRFDVITLASSDQAINGGFYQEFKKHADSLQKSPVTAKTFSPEFTAQVFKKWTDTVKNLTVLPNASIRKIEKSKKGWEIDLKDREIKAEVIVDATQTQSVIPIALAKLDKEDKVSLINPASSYLYRTSVAFGAGANFEPVPIFKLINTGADNLITTFPGGETNFLTGQAAGATAAYCVFFNTNTNNLSVRKIQTELLSYKSQIIRFDDLSDTDSAKVALQHIGVTGILPARSQNGRLLFLPQAPVSTDEIKPALKQYYSRSHVWFLDHKEDKLKLETALDLIKFLASRGEELNREVEKAWKTSLKLTGSYDLKKELTRRELAILLDTYLQPYSVEVDLQGNVRR